tara:strand:- start:356 stop:1294 length:939 start_codon:yes stop_codon:yes gene_type:complete
MANEHAKCLKSLGINISSVISSKDSKTVDKFRILFDIKYKFSNYKEALLHKDIWDAAIICCNEKFIFSYLEKLSKTGKPLLVEKPVTSDFKELKKIIRNKNIRVGFNRRFYNNVSYLKSDLKNKNVDLVKVCIPESSGLETTKTERALPKLVYSNSIHVFDLLLYLFGDISWLSAVKSKKQENLTSCSVLGVNEKKMNISLDLPFNYPENFSITIYAQKIKYVLKPIETLRVYKGMDIQESTDHTSNRVYKPRLQSLIELKTKDKFKLGLLEQDKSFIEFCSSKIADEKLASILDLKSALKSIVSIENLIND